MNWLQNTGQTVTTVDGKVAEVWELNHVNDPVVLSAWARHFREHYCSDADLPDMVAGTGQSNADWLTTVKFPDAKNTPGPGVRSGDFAEILVADYIEFHLGYWCPRELRYEDRWNRNDSTKGCDIVGFLSPTGQLGDPSDQLFLIESKASFTATKSNRLQDAINGSIKDVGRQAMTLNALKQRLLKRDRDQALRVQRYQDPADRPFVHVHGAATVLEHAVFDQMDFATTDASKHPNQGGLRLIVIKGPSMMDLVHALYQRAADEA